MGMYTEFIFGCELSKDTPKECLDSLDYAINGEEGHSYNRWNSKTNKSEVVKYERTTSQEDIDAFIEKWDFWRLFKCSSYYFGAANPIGKFYYDGNDGNYHISTRADCKNYGGQIENFIEYIKPYVTQGSGYDHNIFAYVQYEEAEFPTLYGIDGTYHVDDPQLKKEVERKYSVWSNGLSNIYKKLAPEYAVTSTELAERGLSKDSDYTTADVWTWMSEYIVKKYQNVKVAPTNETLNMLLDKASAKVFDKHYYSKEDCSITSDELKRWEEIKSEFFNLLKEMS